MKTVMRTVETRPVSELCAIYMVDEHGTVMGTQTHYMRGVEVIVTEVVVPQVGLEELLEVILFDPDQNYLQLQAHNPSSHQEAGIYG